MSQRGWGQQSAEQATQLVRGRHELLARFKTVRAAQETPRALWSSSGWDLAACAEGWLSGTSARRLGMTC